MALAVARPVFTLDYLNCAQQSKQVTVDDLPVKGEQAWTVNMLVRTPQQLEDRTVIAGFGSATDASADGTGRYLSKFSGGLHFWSRNTDVDATTPLDVNRWQMLAATYDGETLRLYKNGQPIGDRAVDLSDDEPIVRLAPLDPWDHRRQFKGEIRDFTIWKTDLAPEQLELLRASAMQQP